MFIVHLAVNRNFGSQIQRSSKVDYGYIGPLECYRLLSSIILGPPVLSPILQLSIIQHPDIHSVELNIFIKDNQKKI